MPYVDLHSADDYASIYYMTNTTRGNVGGFRPDRPCLMMLHPVFLDSTWLHQQFGDPRLNESFNIIAFDMRLAGRSEARPAARHDSWVEAADLAFCHQALHLPPCHIFALEGLSINCALRFTVLFPELCLSLILCNVPAPIEMSWIVTAYDELTKTWRYAEDLESFEHIAREAATYVIGANCDVDLQDELIAWWEVHMPPMRGLRTVEVKNVFMARRPLSPEILATITQPILIIHGEHNPTCHKSHAENLSAQLVNSSNNAVVYTVKGLSYSSTATTIPSLIRDSKGGSGTLNVVPGMASMVNRVVHNFLIRLPAVGSELIPPPDNVERMKAALATLADIAGDSSIANRDPQSSLSFSCATDEEVQRQTQALQEYRLGLWDAFSPVGPDGRPFRRFSEKENENWFDVGADNVSVAGTGKKGAKPDNTKDIERERLERLEKSLLKDPASENNARSKRTHNNKSSSADKQVKNIKSSEKPSVVKYVEKPVAKNTEKPLVKTSSKSSKPISTQMRIF